MKISKINISKLIENNVLKKIQDLNRWNILHSHFSETE